MTEKMGNLNEIALLGIGKEHGVFSVANEESWWSNLSNVLVSSIYTSSRQLERRESMEK